jgi:aminoglycoside phosphotransferase (APT) family kinase protein
LRATLAGDFVANLAALHAVDWRRHGLAFLGDPGTGRAPPPPRLARWEDMIARADSPRGAADRRRAVVSSRAPGLRPTDPRHGDYRTGNFIVAGSRAARCSTGRWSLGDPMKISAGCA